MRSTLLGPYFPPEGAPSSLGPPITANTRFGLAATPATPGAPPKIARLRPSLNTRVTWPETLSATRNPRWPTAFCRPNGPSSFLVTTVAALPPPAAADAGGTAATAPAVPSATSDTRAALLRDTIRSLLVGTATLSRRADVRKTGPCLHDLTGWFCPTRSCHG